MCFSFITKSKNSTVNKKEEAQCIGMNKTQENVLPANFVVHTITLLAEAQRHNASDVCSLALCINKGHQTKVLPSMV